MNEINVISIGQRKISELSVYSRIITLPKDWLKERGIDKGNYLDVFETEEGNLLLVPAARKGKC